MKQQEVGIHPQSGEDAVLRLGSAQLYALAESFIAVHPDARSPDLVAANRKVIDAIESIERR